MSEASGVPNKKQQKFILEKLIPFILREQGRGFGMDDWLTRGLAVGADWDADGITRPVPVCGTVCCIGGSVAHLKKIDKTFRDSCFTCGDHLGLNYDEAYGLFFNWGRNKDHATCGWPQKFAVAFRQAPTPYRKALVAARLLKKIAREGGKCLHISKNTEEQ